MRFYLQRDYYLDLAGRAATQLRAARQQLPYNLRVSQMFETLKGIWTFNIIFPECGLPPISNHFVQLSI